MERSGGGRAMGIQEKEALRGLVEGILTVMQSAAGRLVPGWEANEVRWVGLRIMSEANTY